MNIKSKTSIALTLAMISSVFTGCSFAGMSDSDLLQPPKATGTEAAIQSLLEKTTNGDYKLTYPQSGDYRSGIIMQDINGDGKNEAIALYKTSKDTSSINIMFMKENSSGAWESIGLSNNVNSEVDRIYFGDVDEDGKNEMIVGWSSYLTGGNQITMYEYTENNTVTDVFVNSDTRYIDMVLMDITNEGVLDLVVLTTNVDEKTNETTTTARLYSNCANGKFSKVSEIKTNPNIISYSQILQGKVSDNTNGLFMDGNTANANELITEVLYYSEEKKILVNPLDYTKTSGDIENITVRKTSTVCKDIDNDNIIEVPSPYTPVINTNEITPCPIIKWYKMSSDDNSVHETQQTVASYSDGFYFVLPDNWKNNIVATNDNTARTTSFYEIVDEVYTHELSTENTTEKDTEKATVPEISTEPAAEQASSSGEKVSKIGTEPVLVIKVYTDKSWKNESATRLAEGYVVIQEESGFVYTCKLGKAIDSNINLSTDQVKSNFYLI